MRTTRKIGLAAGLLLALVVGFAAPAAATNPIEVKSGFLRTVIGDFDLTPGSQGTPPCPEKPSTLAFTTAQTSTPPPTGTWTLTGGFSGQFQLPPGSGSWYQADFTILGGQGNWTLSNPGPPPTYSLTGTIGIRVDIFRIGQVPGPFDCTKSNRVCRIQSTQTLVAPSTYKTATGNPGLPATTIGDQITLYSNGVAIVSTCAPPFSAVNGTVVTIDNLQATVL